MQLSLMSLMSLLILWNAIHQRQDLSVNVRERSRDIVSPSTENSNSDQIYGRKVLLYG